MEKEDIKTLIEEYKKNFTKLEKIVKKQNKQDEEIRKQEYCKNELFHKLQNKLISSNEYLKNVEEITKKLEKDKQKKDILLIEKKLLFDNENIIIDKMIIDIFKNIIYKYNNKSIGEKTTAKIDEEIKEYLKELYNNKYIEIYSYNEYRQFQPNQFIHLLSSDYSFNNYQKKLVLNLSSKYNNRNDYKQNIYIKDNYLLLNGYSKIEEITEDNQKHINTIKNIEILEDTEKKAKEIYQAYIKKEKTLEKLKKEEEKSKKEFDAIIKNNQDIFYHNLYSYFYR